MSDKYLSRDDAPFSAELWKLIDRSVVKAAKDQLTTRKLIDIEGPYGLGTKTVPGTDSEYRSGGSDQVTIIGSQATPLALLRKKFTIPIRDVAAYEEAKTPIDLSVASAAARAVARQEDNLLLNGSKEIHTDGLMKADGINRVQLKDWAEVGVAAENLIEAVNKLDKAGFHGPYSLALAADLYNGLLRRYPDGDQTEMEHVKQIVTEAIIKAPALDKGGILMPSEPMVATVVLGQDLKAGFIGPEEEHFELFVSESVALRLRRPEAVCVLK